MEQTFSTVSSNKTICNTLEILITDNCIITQSVRWLSCHWQSRWLNVWNRL